MTAELLPANATALERALAEVAGAALDVPVPIDRLWSATTCPAPLLGYLAWALSVDQWDASWPEERQRAVVLAAIPTYRLRGTAGAVKRAVAALGYGVDLRDGATAALYDGALHADGREEHGGRWAVFDAILHLGERGLTPQIQAMLTRAIVTAAPARAHLRHMAWRATDQDDIATGQHFAAAAHFGVIDQRRWGHRYDGGMAHGGVVRHRHDGASAHDGSLPHAGWSLPKTGARYDGQEDPAALAVRPALADAQLARMLADGQMAHDGSGRYGEHGCAADPHHLRATLSTRHDGRQSYAGTWYGRGMVANGAVRAGIGLSDTAPAADGHQGLAVRTMLGDRLPWLLRRHDGAITHDQAMRGTYSGRRQHDGRVSHQGWVLGRKDWRRHDGTITHGGQVPYDGRDVPGLPYDAGADPASLTLCLQDSDLVRLAPRHDGHLTYSGAQYGVSGVMAVEPLTTLRVTRHRTYGGRQRHGGDRYDGSRSHDRARTYFVGVTYAATGIDEQLL
ncbi:phage tail protein I [Niveispirillum sp. SYP-B3756]|uniref:phage tail protein I n=1 Tax=Niveispirillum sp. SYP-B3756 TaxID=2662178 RepID=UPI00129127AC|nr:phage tail protein I [Niveispirillum sp. SYP-B3756]MQP64711.1 phage tail protein I [Niveispirillum sp. SYP-B3756]